MPNVIQMYYNLAAGHIRASLIKRLADAAAHNVAQYLRCHSIADYLQIP